MSPSLQHPIRRAAAFAGAHRRLVVAAALLLAALIAVVFFRSRVGDPTFRVTGDPLPIELVAVQIDGGGTAYGPEGRPLPAPVSITPGPLAWSAGELQRDFVFMVPAGNEPVLFTPFIQVRASRRQSHLSRGQYGIPRVGPEPQTSAVAMTLDSSYRLRPLPLIPWTVTRDVDFVDLTLRYYHGPSGPALLRIEGPFVVGEPVKVEHGELSAKVTFTDPGSSPAPRAHVGLVATGGLPFDTAVVAYDAKGRRYLARSGGGSGSGSSIDKQYTIDGVTAADIAALALGEEPRERTFHGVRVTYPGVPPRTHAPVLDAVIRRLGLPPSATADLAKRPSMLAPHAIEVLDLVEGPLVATAVQAIADPSSSLKPEMLSPEQRDVIKAAAASWAEVPATREAGVTLGLWLGEPRYVDPALDIIARGGRAAQPFPRLLSERKALLTPAHLGRIRDMLPHAGRHAETASRTST